VEDQQSFGSGRSQIRLKTDSEFELLDYTISADAQSAALTFFWITGWGMSSTEHTNFKEDADIEVGAGSPSYVDYALWRFYLDGASTPTLGPVSTSQAAFVGKHDPSANWDNDFFGKNSATGGWHVNMLIPFSKSIRVTIQLPTGLKQKECGAYAMARGVENIPLSIGGISLPANARLQIILQSSLNLPTLEFHDLVNIASGRGRLVGSMIEISTYDNGTLNSLEGCWHAFLPGTEYDQYPALVLGTGSEDYPESAYYFNAGPYRGPTSGLTIMERANSTTHFSNISFYKLHHRDPIFFKNGFRFVWRNGDVTDPATGEKCTQIKGTICGRPGVSNVSSIAYLYTY